MLRGAERVCWTKWSVVERGDCKRRGRGLGQRNSNKYFCHNRAKNIQKNCNIFIIVYTILYYTKFVISFMKIELNVIKDNNHVDKDILKEEMEKILLACLKESGIKRDNILLNVTFCDRKAMLKLNRETRNEHHATNVLSCFPKTGLINNLVKSGFIQADQVDKYLGDIVFCIDVVEEEAEKLKIPPKERYYMLFAHALYHALGLNHETKEDEEKFNNLVRQVLLNFGIKDPYLYNCYDDTDVD